MNQTIMRPLSTGTLLFLLPCLTLGALPIAISSVADVPSRDASYSYPTNGDKARALLLRDLFRLESIEQVAFAPDGRSVAFVRRRPAESNPALSAQERGDVWISSLDGGAVFNVTQGETSGTGYWEPTWAPDGRSLAMLSTKDGIRVQLSVWRRGIDAVLTLGQDVAVNSLLEKPFAWIDGNSLATIYLPGNGVAEDMRADRRRRTGAIVLQQWHKSWEGREPTTSVLDSGVPAELEARPTQTLVVHNLATGRASLVSSAYSFRGINVAPTGGFLAFLEQTTRLRPDPTQLIFNDPYGCFGGRDRFRLRVWDANNQSILPAASNHSVLPATFRWSPDSRTYAFIGQGKSGSTELVRGNVAGPSEVVALPNLTPERLLLWTAKNELIVFARTLSAATVTGPSSSDRRDWWLVSRGGRPRNLTEGLPVAPSELVADSTNGVLATVLDGALWTLNLRERAWRKRLAEGNKKGVPSIAWPSPDGLHQRACGGPTWPADEREWTRGTSQIIVANANDQQLAHYSLVDLRSGRTEQLSTPNGGALAAYSSVTGTAVYEVEDRTGTFLWQVRNGHQREITHTNTFLASIAEGVLRQFSYRSVDGKDLTAWLLLPPGYQGGVKYPLVTHVYNGYVVADGKPASYLLLTAIPHVNLQLLAARGYAVLFPSMPLDGKEGDARDPLIGLTHGVLPAVDKLIDDGVVDETRLALMGHSNGGYSVAGLIAQTGRFKAAIAQSGVFDLVSQYGFFSHKFRYEAFPQENLWAQLLSETDQQRMGNPPWKDWSRFLRNSPLFYVDRIQTPLLLLHGDMDGATSITQSEQLFTALYRQDKRARFVRYWGEEHGFTSPANSKDMWARIFAWLDEFCDISRDSNGNMLLDRGQPRSRNGAAPLTFGDFQRFDDIADTVRGVQ